MATVNYYLKGALSKERIELLHKENKSLLQNHLDTPLQIYLKLSTGGERLQVYTKKRIPQKFWNSEKQEIDCKKFKSGGVKMNEWLFDLKNNVMKAAEAKEYESKRITPDELKEILGKRILNKTSKDDFEEYFKKFLAKQKTREGHSLKIATIQKYNSFHKRLKEFAEDAKISLEISQIDKDFLFSFKDFLTHKKTISDNGVVKHLKAAKALVKFYTRQGLIKPTDLSEIKTIEREKEVYILPIKQVLEVQSFNFKTECLRKVRDIFCFMCWTGQRFSDTQALRHEDIIINENGEKIWKLITNKTEEPISVPIVPYAEEILAKYTDEEYPIPQLSNQKMNDYLKDLGKEIEFDSKIKVVKYYDGQRKETFVPFYDVLTTHVARKSFITNLLILGVPERVVREVSGHKDERSFRRYVKLAETYKTNLINKAFSFENLNNVVQ